jgi:hypothetical protein
MARCTSNAATALSTPPDRPHIANARHLVVNNVRGGPRGCQVAGIKQEALEQIGAEGRVHDLGVELHAKATVRRILHRGDGSTGGLGRYGEALGRRRDGVAVAHPAGVHGQIAEEAGS